MDQSTRRAGKKIASIFHLSGWALVTPSFFCTAAAHTSPRGVYRHQVNLCTRLTKVSINNYVISVYRKLGNWKLCACMQ